MNLKENLLRKSKRIKEIKGPLRRVQIKDAAGLNSIAIAWARGQSPTFENTSKAK